MTNLHDDSVTPPSLGSHIPGGGSTPHATGQWLQQEINKVSSCVAIIEVKLAHISQCSNAHSVSLDKFGSTIETLKATTEALKATTETLKVTTDMQMQHVTRHVDDHSKELAVLTTLSSKLDTLVSATEKQSKSIELLTDRLDKLSNKFIIAATTVAAVVGTAGFILNGSLGKILATLEKIPH